MNELRARVISQEKGVYKISVDGNVKSAAVSGKFRYDAKTASDYPAVGDYVVARCQGDESAAVITALFPRKSCFIRRAAGTKSSEQTVAANIDTVFVCMALNRDFNIRRLERYLAIVWESGALPVVVLTKSDICADLNVKLSMAQAAAPGVDVVAVSSLENGFNAVLPYVLPGKTVAFIGSSGVGKSTLINRLSGEDRLATREIGADGRGRHTTTRRALFELSNGAFVIDTPGMREVGMWNSEQGIDAAFCDIEELARGCKYRNCTHSAEPGCAVKKAVEEGKLDAMRLASFKKLAAENDYAANSSQYLEAKREKFKNIAKINKSSEKNRL